MIEFIATVLLVAFLLGAASYEAKAVVQPPIENRLDV